MLQQILLQILLLNCFLRSIVLYPQTCSKRYQHCKTYRSSGEIVIIFCCPEKKKKIIFNCFHMWNRKYHDKQRYFNVVCTWNHEKIHKCTLYMYIYRNKSNTYRIIYAVKCVILWCFMSYYIKNSQPASVCYVIFFWMIATFKTCINRQWKHFIVYIVH